MKYTGLREAVPAQEALFARLCGFFGMVTLMLACRAANVDPMTALRAE